MSEDLDELFLTPIPAPSAVELQQCILFGFRRRLHPAQIFEECRNAFGPFCPSAQYVAKWYQRFQDGFFNLDEKDDEELRIGHGGTPTTCSDYDDDSDCGEATVLPLILSEMIHRSEEDDDDDGTDGFEKESDDGLDGHVIGYWQGYGYLGGKQRYSWAGTKLYVLNPSLYSMILIRVFQSIFSLQWKLGLRAAPAAEISHRLQQVTVLRFGTPE